MKKIGICILLLFLIICPINVFAKSGCCSHHGGVAGCYGEKQLCNDGTLSKTCYCEPKYVDYKKTSSYSSNTNYLNSNYRKNEETEDDNSSIGYIIAGTLIVLSIFGSKK